LPQLAAAGAISHRFGLCFGFPDGGVLLLGDAPLPPSVGALAWTPLLQTARHAYYGVTLLGIDVGAPPAPGVAAAAAVTPAPGAWDRRGGARGGGGASAAGGGGGGSTGGSAAWRPLALEPSVFTQGYGTVMDSGSNMNHLPTAAYRALTEQLNATMARRGKRVWKVGARGAPGRAGASCAMAEGGDGGGLGVRGKEPCRGWEVQSPGATPAAADHERYVPRLTPPSTHPHPMPAGRQVR
jgi:hypothetical protein